MGIDDSLHALHRYKEERKNGATTTAATEVTLTRVGRAIMLTSLTTMSAFAANLFSDVAALRSFGVEAALGILAAFLLTGLWVPLIRLTVDEWMDKRKKDITEKKMTHLVSEDFLTQNYHYLWKSQTCIGRWPNRRFDYHSCGSRHGSIRRGLSRRRFPR